MLADKHVHSSPRPISTLTTTPKLTEPILGDAVYELFQTIYVAGNGVIVHPALHHTTEPASGFADGVMPTLA